MQQIHQSSSAAGSLDRQHLQLLLAVRDTGRLGRAAEALAISPSAASHRLREAERRLGVALAVPDGRSLRLTPSGQHLADVASVSESVLVSGETTARWLAGGRAASVRLAMGFYDTAPWFTAFAGASASSGRGVDVVRVGYNRAFDSVVQRRAEVALGPFPVAADTAPSADGPLALTEVAVDDLVAVVPGEHESVERGEFLPTDVIGQAYLTAGLTPTSGFEHSEFFAPAGAMPGTLFQIESVALILRLVAEGRGLTVQPRRVVEASVPTGAKLLPLAGRPVRVRWIGASRPGDTEALGLLDDISTRIQPAA